MHNYQEILTQQDLNHLFVSFDHFHDSLCKEFHVINRGYIATNHSIIMNHQFDGQVLIQSQSAPHAIELLFIHILEIHMFPPNIIDQATGHLETSVSKFTELENRTITMHFDRIHKIVAQSLFYRVRENWLGQTACLTTEVPTPLAFMAKQLDGNWRQCSNCAEAWEYNLDLIYSLCPTCGQLTELIDTK